MILFPGGLSKGEWAPTNSFPGTEIYGLMKESKIEFKTPTEEDAAGRNGSSGQAVDFTLVSKDLDPTHYTGLIAADAAHTPEFFKFTGLDGVKNLVLKNCIITTHIQPEVAGKLWKRIVIGSGFAANEADLFALTLS